MSTVTRWWWVRHAPVPDGGRIYGQSDLDCDCGDTEIFRILARELPRNAVWVTSNLARTRQTAAAILAAADPRQVRRHRAAWPIPDLAEQHLGEWQGQERKAFYAARRVGTHTLWFAPADERPPGGESFADLVQRVGPAIERLNLEHRGKDIIAVTHGGTIRAALGFGLGLDAAGVARLLRRELLADAASIISPPTAAPGLWRVVAVNHRPWSRTPAAEHLGHNPVAIDKA